MPVVAVEEVCVLSTRIRRCRYRYQQHNRSRDEQFPIHLATSHLPLGVRTEGFKELKKSSVFGGVLSCRCPHRRTQLHSASVLASLLACPLFRPPVPVLRSEFGLLMRVVEASARWSGEHMERRPFRVAACGRVLVLEA